MANVCDKLTNLMREYAAGDDAALGDLFELHNPALLQRAKNRSIPPSDVEDIVQDTWLRVAVKRHEFDSTNMNFATWVVRQFHASEIKLNRRNTRYRPFAESQLA